MKVITNSTFKEVFKPSCTVKLDNEVTTLNDFVAVGYDEKTQETYLLQNADAVTLGQALQLISLKFNEAMSNLSDEDKKAVQEVLAV